LCKQAIDYLNLTTAKLNDDYEKNLTTFEPQTKNAYLITFGLQASHAKVSTFRATAKQLSQQPPNWLTSDKHRNTDSDATIVTI